MTASHPTSEYDFSKINFLVVADKPLFRDMVHSALRGRTRSLRDAMNVDRALEVLKTYGSQIHCIISDWDMAPITGLELLRMVRCRTMAQVSPRTSYVILTTRADTAAVKCAIDLDVNGFAVAPLSLEKLVKTIGTALHRTWMLQQPTHYAAIPGFIPAPLTPDGSYPPSSHDTSPRAGALRNVRICGIADLRPGAILAKDVCDPQGKVLIPSGTELQPPLIERLRSATEYVWIGDSHGR